jgi:hypothetical protein
MIKLGLAFVSTSRHKLPDFGPGLALRSRSARAYSYRRGLLHGGCNAVIRSAINLI